MSVQYQGKVLDWRIGDGQFPYAAALNREVLEHPALTALIEKATCPKGEGRHTKETIAMTESIDQIARKAYEREIPVNQAVEEVREVLVKEA
ncbi:MAG: hypothetical protein V1702_03655 [Candidatus Woesearchaeota archaeon]